MIYETPNDAYLDTVRQLIYNPTHKSAPRGQKIFEILHHQFTITSPSSAPLKTLDPDRNEKIEAYTKAEFELYARGENTVVEFEKASKFWTKLQNPDGTINSAYGWLIFYDRSCGNPLYEVPWITTKGDTASAEKEALRTPWEWARLSLITDKDSRQAVIKFHKRKHLWVGNKDQTCTLSGSFLIRNDRLHLIIHMRSNDVIKGLSYDLPWFCYLMERMCRELKSTYPLLEIGTYTHFVDSLHVYESDLDLACKLIGHNPQEEFKSIA